MFMRIVQSLLLAGTCASSALLFTPRVLAAQSKEHPAPVPLARAQSSKATPPANTARPSATETAPESPAHPLDSADLDAFFDGLFRIQLERSDVAGATVLVMKDGKTLLEKGYGYSDWKKKKPVDPITTGFRLASISKLFTWVSVMQLVE